MKDWFEVVIIVLVLFTFLTALRAMVALYRVERRYRARVGDSDVLDRQRRWAWVIGMAAIPVAFITGWALLRYVAPEWNLGGLPAPLTSVVIVVLVNLPLLWLINLDRTWARFARMRREP